MAAKTSGIASPVAVRRQAAGRGRVEAPTKRARSSSSMTCWVPILVAFKRPDLIQRRTVSGSRLVRRAASGTVNIVAPYYNKSCNEVQHNTGNEPRHAAARSDTRRIRAVRYGTAKLGPAHAASRRRGRVPPRSAKLFHLRAGDHAGCLLLGVATYYRAGRAMMPAPLVDLRFLCGRPQGVAAG
jgi:hypothetical protein